MSRRSELYENLPGNPGVYLMKDAEGGILYVGKAGNLKRRVSSYFTRPQEMRIERLLAHAAKIDFQETDTAIEALILEADLIKRFAPPYNVREKDDKSFLCIEITREPFPRVLLVRSKDKTEGARFGPFTSASNLREAVRIIRRIFPFNTHPPEKIAKLPRPCFDFEVGLCPGTCVNAVSRQEYAKTIRNIKLFLQGKKARILALLDKEMKAASKKLAFEEAEKIRRQIFALRHIQDVALITDAGIGDSLRPEGYRIEGYDISNISGTSAVGSMVVFTDSRPDKSQYRKFRIRAVRRPGEGGDDTGMLTEVLSRRFKNDWPLPNLILIDGGIGQVNAARRVLSEAGLKIPLVGLAKGPERKRNDVIGKVPPEVRLETLVRVRNEAHRFAISYHKTLRSRALFE